MENQSKNKTKILIVLSTKEDVLKLHSLTSTFKEKNRDLILLGLDFQPRTELKKRNLPYITPAEYLKQDKCVKIGLKAKDLALNWYNPLNHKITYHGISFGEMYEGTFIILFIGALRAINIANSMIEIEEPDEIWLPHNIPQYYIGTIRYDILPKALKYLAKKKGIKLSYYNSKSVSSIIMNQNSKIIYDLYQNYFHQNDFLSKKLSSLFKILYNVFSRVINRKSFSIMLFIKDLIIRISLLFHIKRIRLKMNEYSQYKYKIVFVNVPPNIFLPIKRELEKNQETIAINILEEMWLLGSHQNDDKIKELIKIWNTTKKNTKYSNNLVYNNISLIEILSEEFFQFFSVGTSILLRNIDATEKLIQTIKPDMALVMSDGYPDKREIIRVFKKKEIPTIVIQHGILSSDLLGFYVLPIEADIQAVWGNICKEWSILRGKSPETQVITGNPKFDQINTLKNNSKKKIHKIYKKLDLNFRTEIIIIATEWYSGVNSCFVPEDEETFIRKTLKAMKAFPDKQIIVKLHPRNHTEYKALANQIINDLQIDNVVITESFLWELLSICDLLITSFSTVGLEAMLFNKPVITYHSKRFKNLNPYAESGAVIEIHEEEDLVPAIKDALSNTEVRKRLAEARKKFIYEYAYLQDGNASKRVANLIKRQIIKFNDK